MLEWFAQYVRAVVGLAKFARLHVDDRWLATLMAVGFVVAVAAVPWRRIKRFVADFGQWLEWRAAQERARKEREEFAEIQALCEQRTREREPRTASEKAHGEASQRGSSGNARRTESVAACSVHSALGEREHTGRAARKGIDEPKAQAGRARCVAAAMARGAAAGVVQRDKGNVRVAPPPLPPEARRRAEAPVLLVKRTDGPTQVYQRAAEQVEVDVDAETRVYGGDGGVAGEATRRVAVDLDAHRRRLRGESA